MALFDRFRKKQATEPRELQVEFAANGKQVKALEVSFIPPFPCGFEFRNVVAIDKEGDIGPGTVVEGGSVRVLAAGENFEKVQRDLGQVTAAAKALGKTGSTLPRPLESYLRPQPFETGRAADEVPGISFPDGGKHPVRVLGLCETGGVTLRYELAYAPTGRLDEAVVETQAASGKARLAFRSEDGALKAIKLREQTASGKWKTTWEK